MKGTATTSPCISSDSVITLCVTYHKIGWSIESKRMSHDRISNNFLSSYITPSNDSHLHE